MKFFLAIFCILLFSVLIAAKKSSSSKTTSKSGKTMKNKSKKSSSLPKKKVSLDDDNDDDDDDSNKDEFDSPVSSSSFAQSTFDLTKQLAVSIGKVSKSLVKSTVDLCVVKHVTEDQIRGKWLLRQEVEVRKGIFVSCPATVQFMEDGTVVTVFEGVQHKNKLTFTERQWPLKCTVKFEAKAFQGMLNAVNTLFQYLYLL